MALGAGSSAGVGSACLGSWPRGLRRHRARSSSPKYRRPQAHSWLCWARTAPTTRITASRMGKIPTLSAPADLPVEALVRGTRPDLGYDYRSHRTKNSGQIIRPLACKPGRVIAYQAVQPPSTARFWPVIYDACSPSKKRIA